jgi:TonB family protein
MGRRSIVAAFSIFVHALVLLLLMTADLWRPISEWPTPHIVMAFEPPRVVRLDDIKLPPQSARVKGLPTPTGPARPTEAAPVAAPPALAPEIERQESTGASVGGPGRVEDFFSGLGSGIALPAPVFSPPPPQQPRTPIRPHSGIKAPERVVHVAPVYPVAARAAHVEGIVIIEATIDEQGNVTQTRLLRSIPLLDDAAVAAVQRWKFSPTLLNGVPVPIVMTVTVHFTLTP